MLMKIFLTPLPVDNIFGKNLHDLVKILGNVGQTMTTPPPPPPPPPNVDGFATSLAIIRKFIQTLNISRT